MPTELSLSSSLQIPVSYLDSIKPDCAEILFSGVLRKTATYVLSFFSDSSYIEYLKRFVCETLFDSKNDSFKTTVVKFIGTGQGNIQSFVRYADRAKLGSKSLVEILAHTHDRNNQLSFLGESARYGMLEVVDALLNNGADPNLGSCKPLHRAAMGASKSCSNPKYTQIAIALINKSALVNAQDGAHKTPLHLSSNCLPFVKALVEEGKASLNIQDVDGLTPLDLAEASNWIFSFNNETVNYLKSKNAENGLASKLGEGLKYMLLGDVLSFDPYKYYGMIKTGANLVNYQWNQFFYTPNNNLCESLG